MYDCFITAQPSKATFIVKPPKFYTPKNKNTSSFYETLYNVHPLTRE